MPGSRDISSAGCQSSPHPTEILGISRPSVPSEDQHGLGDGGGHDDAATTYETGAFAAQSLAGVIVGVGDLTVGNPDNLLPWLPASEGEPKRRTINPVSDVPRRESVRSATAISQEPRVRRVRSVAGSVAVAHHGRPGEGS